MSWIGRLFLPLRSLFRKDQAERELAEELQFHLESEIRKNLAAGMNPEEARYSALRGFGGLEQIKEECRDVRGVRWIETLWQDLRYGLRILRKNPGFTAVAVLTLALGVGANTAVFSVINTVLLRPLPYKNPDRLALLWTDDPKRDIHEEGTSYPTFEDWRAQNQVFEDLALCSRRRSLTLTGIEEPERITGEGVSANFFPLLGVPPALGRTFSAEEVERRDRVVVLSYRLWQRRFGSSADVIGKTLEIDDKNFQVIGLMPAHFQFPSKNTELWEPHTLDPWWDRVKASRYSDWWRVVGRLKPNVTFRQAQAEMSAIGRHLEQAYPIADSDFAGFGVNVVPLHLQITGNNLRRALWVLLGAVVFVLLIACTNVANLLLARGAAREREFALRAALGAGRARLIRQLLTESAALSLVAGFLGVLFAAVGIRVLIGLGSRDISRLDDIVIDSTVLTFTLAISLLAGILFGLAPAWKISRSDPNEPLKEGARSSSGGSSGRRTRGLLVVVEFALAVVLLSGAGLLIRSFILVQSVDPGFRPERVLILRILLPQSKTGAQTVAFYQQAMERLETLPEVEAAGAISRFFIENNPDVSIIVEGHPAMSSGQPYQLQRDAISGDYFQTVGVRLLRGRFFSHQDGPDSPPVVIINETLARRYWPGEDPIGKRLKFGAGPWRSIVGVVANMCRQGLEKQAIAQTFQPHTQSPRGDMDLVVRSAFDPLKLAGAVRSVIRSLDKTLPLFGISTVERRLEEFSSQRRFQTVLLALFAGIALVLAAIGIYGLMHYSVMQRTHEIGIRMALGAQPSDILGMVIRQGLVLALIGVTVGVLGSLWLTQTLSSLLYGVTATDVVTFVSVPLLLTGVALLACYLPARRATKVDPLVALRHE